MIATLVNCAAVVLGSLIGLLLHRRIGDSFRSIVYAGAGLISVVLGLKMAFESSRIVYLALALISGGLLGEWWNLEGGILRFGEFLKRTFVGRRAGGSESSFAHGFLDASVIFCVGAMTLVGAFKAGAEGDYQLLLTKSVMDGFMAIVLTAAMGVGVAFAALTILIYQGGLTLAAGLLKPLVSDTLLAELTGTGGILVLIIGINLLGLRKIKTANFLPSLIVITLLVALEPAISGLFS